MLSYIKDEIILKSDIDAYHILIACTIYIWSNRSSSFMEYYGSRETYFYTYKGLTIVFFPFE